MVKPKNKLNRLILIGNGFDLMHDLKTSYGDFIRWYLTRCVKKFFADEVCIEKLIKIHYEGMYRPVPRPEYSEEDVIDFFQNVNDYKSNGISINIEWTPFFKNIYNKLKYGWVDIEKEYYLMLTSYYKKFESSISNKENVINEVKELNEELAEISDLLRKYLLIQQDKYNVNGHFSRSNLRLAYRKLEENDFPQFELSDHKDIDKVLYLNFNYTQPKFNHYPQAEYQSCEVVNIHGTLEGENPMIFGYGDELDEYYKLIEQLGEDEWLKGIKSFGYLQNQNYNDLIGFIERGEFQVYVVGHSCGLSDKTLLNQIFEHRFCKSIKVFYHKFTAGERKGQDTFNETIYNISRIMADKVKLRNIVAKKDNSELIENLYTLVPVNK